MDLPKRKSPRLKEYDYSTPGYYFVTVCTHKKAKILSDIVGEGFHALPKTKLTSIGKEVKSAIEKIDSLYPDFRVDKYVIMPNHIHLILIKLSEAGGHGGSMTEGHGDPITGGHGDPPLRQRNKIGVDDVIGRFKSYTTYVYGKPLWQRSFHDHIIRGEKDYQKIWQYVHTNPSCWKGDCFYLEY